MKRRFPALAGACLALLAAACSQLPTPPSGSAPSDAQLNAQGFSQDGYGIWHDPILGRPFADMPVAYREFWRYCASCHSSSGQKAEAREARRALRIDTWSDARAFGLERLILAVKAGGMPLRSAAPVPDEVLERAETYLAAWSDTARGRPLIGFRYKDAETFVRRYCADCHAPWGTDAQQPEASQRILLDAYASWYKRRDDIRSRLDPATHTPDQPIMPPQDYPSQPDSAARAGMLDWLSRNAPNTPDGSGTAPPPPSGGAVHGLIYDTAAALINRYCAQCHTEGGYNAQQWDAWAAIQFDTYAQWKNAGALTILRRLDPDSIAIYNPMPPVDAVPRPTDAERRVLTDWLRRNSPNTANGQ